MIHRNLIDLVPAFRERIEELVKRMNEKGHDPWVYETWRSLERAEDLAARGAGKINSMHRYAVAADIISRTYKWGAGELFWNDLGLIAHDLKLTWGGTFHSRIDKPHVQAVPPDLENKIRGMSFENREAFLRKYYT